LCFFIDEQHPQRATNHAINAKKNPKETMKKFTGMGSPSLFSLLSKYIFTSSNISALEAIRPAIAMKIAARNRSTLKKHNVIPQHYMVLCFLLQHGLKA